jgi:hypothetical protein
LHKNFAVPPPAAGIGHFLYRPAPFRQRNRAPHVILNRSQQRHDGRRFEPPDASGKRSLPRATSSPPGFRIKMVDRLDAGIDQITSRALKNG